MEMTLAVLMVLGIFVGIPALIGFAIAGAYTLKVHRVVKAGHEVEAATKAKVLVA